jgi:ferredoxin-NADP reductase
LQWQAATLTSIQRQTARASSFFFRLAQPIAFVAGQHMDVRLTAPDGYQAQRSYSIASAPESAGDLELVIERLEHGEVSPFFHEVAQAGDVIELRGPIGGHFIWSVTQPGPVLLLGGGSGLVPLMSMVRHRFLRHATTPMLLLLSVRSWDEVIFREELLSLSRQDTGFQCIFTTTRSPRTRELDYDRRVDASMMAELLQRMPAPPATVYVCGADGFVEAAAQGLIESSVSAAVIRTERYGA